MKASLASACLLLALFALAAPSSAQATTIVSSVTHYPSLGIVEGYTATNLSYPAAYYYNAVADAYLYDQNWLLRDHRYSEGGSSASVTTVTSATPGLSYYLYGDHYAGAYFYYCDSYCTQPQYYDYCGFSQLAGGSYGGYYYFECYYFCYFFYAYVYLGGTFDAVTVPQYCPPARVELYAMLANNAFDNQNGQTKPALLGTKVPLEARALDQNNNEIAGGTFTWNVTGNHLQNVVQGGKEIDIYWRVEGQHTVTVTFTQSNGCAVSASMNAQVILPTVTSYTAQQDVEQINRNLAQNCSNIPLPARDTFSLGCHPTVSPGITFSATIQSPSNIISDPSDAQVRFVQLVSQYRQRETANGTQCLTYRSSPSDVESGWALDGSDPYDNLGGPGVAHLNSNGSATITTRDTPGNQLDFPLQYQNLSVDDQFIMYVKYRVGNPNNPVAERVIGALSWRWGGEVTYHPFNGQYTYTQVNPVPKLLTGLATNEAMRPYTGPDGNPRFAKIDEPDWANCPGSPPPPPPPGGYCDWYAEQNCYYQGWWWDPNNCTCTPWPPY